MDNVRDGVLKFWPDVDTVMTKCRPAIPFVFDKSVGKSVDKSVGRSTGPKKIKIDQSRFKLAAFYPQNIKNENQSVNPQGRPANWSRQGNKLILLARQVANSASLVRLVTRLATRNQELATQLAAQAGLLY